MTRNKECCKDKANWINDKFKDVIRLEGDSYTVYIGVCKVCGEVDEERTWVE